MRNICLEGEKEKREKMGLKSRVLVILLILMLMVTFPVIQMVSAQIDPPIVPEGSGNPEPYGPRVDDLLYIVYSDVLTESAALEAGEIDVMDVAAPGAYVAPWLDDPNITMGEYSEWGFYEFDINNQMWPIGHGEMEQPNPWTVPDDYEDPHNMTLGLYWLDYDCQRCKDARNFRRALAQLVDRAALSAHMMGFGEMMGTWGERFGVTGWGKGSSTRFSIKVQKN